MLDVICLTWNTLDHTSQTLSELCDATETSFRLIVLDNGSEDGTWEWLETFDGSMDGHELVTIRNETNVGYTKGINQCLEVSLAGNPTAIVLMNSDAYVTPGWDTAMLRAMSEGVGIVCPKVVSKSMTGLIESAGDTLIPPRGFWATKNNRYDDGDGHIYIEEPHLVSKTCTAHRGGWEQLKDWDKPEEISIAPFVHAMLNPNMVRHIGMLDEQYVIYFSDTEYCWRARQNGWKVMYEPTATIYHIGGETGKRGLAGNTAEYREMLEHDAQKFNVLYELLLPEVLKKYPHTAADSRCY